jgi:hypothetical protein
VLATGPTGIGAGAIAAGRVAEEAPSAPAKIGVKLDEAAAGAGAGAGAGMGIGGGGTAGAEAGAGAAELAWALLTDPPERIIDQSRSAWPLEIASARADTSPREVHAATLQARVLTADITNLLFAGVGATILVARRSMRPPHRPGPTPILAAHDPS